MKPPYVQCRFRCIVIFYSFFSTRFYFNGQKRGISQGSDKSTLISIENKNKIKEIIFGSLLGDGKLAACGGVLELLTLDLVSFKGKKIKSIFCFYLMNYPGYALLNTESILILI
jgi:hypothetical protein